jgi:hypothetical protein
MSKRGTEADREQEADTMERMNKALKAALQTPPRKPKRSKSADKGR